MEWYLPVSYTHLDVYKRQFEANAVQRKEAIHGIRMFLSWLPAMGTVLSVIFIIPILFPDLPADVRNNHYTA